MACLTANIVPTVLWFTFLVLYGEEGWSSKLMSYGDSACMDDKIWACRV